MTPFGSKIVVFIIIMNGNLLISQARELGRDTQNIYRPYNKLYSALKSFVDSDYFGVSAYEDELECWVPMHVNGANNPKPCLDHRGRPCRRKFQKRDLILHLAAEPGDRDQNFRFLVNSPKGNHHLLGWDIDAKDGHKAHEITCDLYFDCFWSRWDYGGNVYIEPSRNRRGRYIWTVIERTSSPAEFNLLVNALSRALRSRFRLDDENKFDAVKGTLHYDSRNDLKKLYAEADGDINDDHRGVLVTMPLSGAVARRTFEVESADFLSFLAKKKKRYVNAIPEGHLRELLTLYGPQEVQRLDAEVAKLRKEADVPSPLCPSPPVGNTLRMSAPLGSQAAHTQDRLRSKAHAEVSGKNRMRFVSSLYFYTYDHYAPSPAALVAFYKAEGFAKGDESPKKEKSRLRRAREALDDHTANPAKQGFDRNYWMGLVARWVTEEVRQHLAVKYRSPRTGKVMHVEDDLLAAGLYVLTLSAFAPNRTDWMHTCSQLGQEGMYEKLTNSGLLTAKYEDKRKRVAVPVMLQLSGLIVLRDAKWKFGGKKDGFGHAFGLGVNHPRFNQFTALHGHVVDPQSAPAS